MTVRLLQKLTIWWIIDPKWLDGAEDKPCVIAVGEAGMMRRMGLRAVLGVWLAVAGMAVAETGSLDVVESCPFPLPAAAQGETEYVFDKTYAKLGSQDLRYDLALPVGPGKYPLLIVLHGGGFVSGDKTAKFPEEELRMIAARGYVVATLNYALAGPEAGEGPQSNFPQAIKDLRCGVQYFRAADDPQLAKIDAARIGVLGPKGLCARRATSTRFLAHSLRRLKT